MRSYSEYIRDTGIDFESPYPEVKYRWYSYDGPSVYGPFESASLAKQFSRVISCVPDEKSQLLKDNMVLERKAASNAAHAAFMIDLRIEFIGLTDAQFNVLYETARDATDSGGFDDVYIYMLELLDFYEAMSAENT